MRREGDLMPKIAPAYSASVCVQDAATLTHPLDMMLCAIHEDEDRQALYQVVSQCSQHLKEARSILEAMQMSPERKSA